MKDICKFIIVFFGILTTLSILTEAKKNKLNPKKSNIVNKNTIIINELPKHFIINSNNFSGSSVKNKIFIKHDKNQILKKQIEVVNENKKNNFYKDILFPEKVNISENKLNDNNLIDKDSKNNKNKLNNQKITLPNKNGMTKKRVVKMITNDEKYNETNNQEKINEKINKKSVSNNDKKIKPLSSYSHLQKVTPNSPIHHHNACSHMKYRF
jgi:hypothetical protein